jgi:hypothetical protein
MTVASQPPPQSDPPDPAADLTTVEARQWTYKEVASAKRVTVQTIMEWKNRGMIPSPVYTGSTARFTPDQVAVILSGTSKPNTYEVTPSPRAQIGKLGGGSKVKKPGKARNPAQVKRDNRPKPALKPISPRRKKPVATTPKPAKKGGKK